MGGAETVTVMTEDELVEFFPKVSLFLSGYFGEPIEFGWSENGGDDWVWPVSAFSFDTERYGLADAAVPGWLGFIIEQMGELWFGSIVEQMGEL